MQSLALQFRSHVNWVEGLCRIEKLREDPPKLKALLINLNRFSLLAFRVSAPPLRALQVKYRSERLIHFSTCVVYDKTSSSFLPKNRPRRKVKYCSENDKRLIHFCQNVRTWCMFVTKWHLFVDNVIELDYNLEVMESVVSLQYSKTFRGTGFVVHNSPETFLVMTCMHVIKAYKTLQIAFPGQTGFYQATVAKSGPADIALLKFVPDDGCLGCVPLKFASLDTPLDRGDVQLIAFHEVGLGRLLYPGVFDGKISGNRVDGFIYCDYTNEQGTSGGPVLKDNMVVGVNSNRQAAVRRAVSVRRVCTTLQEWLNMENSDIGIDDMLPLLAQAST